MHLKLTLGTHGVGCRCCRRCCRPKSVSPLNKPEQTRQFVQEGAVANGSSSWGVAKVFVAVPPSFFYGRISCGPGGCGTGDVTIGVAVTT